MQGGFKYKGASSVKVPTYKPLKPNLADEEQLYQTIDTQYQNLGKRLEAVGADQIADNRGFVEKMFNLPDDQNLFLDLIEVIERPMRAIQGGILGATESANMTEGALKGFMGGLTGDDRFTGLEFAERMGWVNAEDLSGFESFFWNVAIDIAMDPFTYLHPTRAVAKLFKKGVKAVPGVAATKAGAGLIDEAFKKIDNLMTADNIKFVDATTDQLIEYGKRAGIDIFLDADAAKVYSIAGADNYIRYASETVTKGGTTQTGVGDLLADFFRRNKEDGLDYWVGVRNAAGHGDDVSVYRRLKMGDGALVDIGVRVADAKDMVGGAFGKKINFQFTADGTLEFYGSNFEKLAPELQQKFTKFLNDLQVEAGQKGIPFAQYLDETINSGKGVLEDFEKLIRSGNIDDTVENLLANLGDAKYLDYANQVQETQGFIRSTLTRLTKVDDMFSSAKAAQRGQSRLRKTFKQLTDSEFAKAMQEATQELNLLGMGSRKVSDLSPTAKQVYDFFLTEKSSVFHNLVRTQSDALGQQLGIGFNKASLVKRLGVDEKTATDFFDLIGEVATGADRGEWYAFIDTVDGEEVLRVMNGEFLLNNSTFNTSMGWMASGDIAINPAARFQNRTANLAPGVRFPKDKLKDKAFIEQLDEQAQLFMDNFFVKGTDEIPAIAGEQAGLVIRMLEALKGSRVTPVRKLAQAADKAIDIVGNAFNWSKGLTKNFKTQLRRQGGEVGFKMQKDAARLDNLIKTAANTPEKERFVRELIEAGARVNEAGEVVVETFTPAMVDIINNIKFHAASGRTALMGTWGKTGKDLDMLAKNLQDQLNQIYKGKLNVDDAFQVLVKDGGLGINLKSIDSKTLNKTSFDDVVDVFTGGGTYKLSNEAKEFFLKNADQIDQIKQLQFGIIDAMKKDALYDVANESLKGAPGYFRHSLSDQAKEFLKKQKPAARSRYIQEGVDMLTSRTYMGTVDDVNKGMRAFYGMDFDFFDTGLRRGMEDLITIAARKTEQSQLLNLILKSSDESGQPLFQAINNTADAAEELGNGFVAIKKFDEQFADIYKNMTPEAQAVFNKHLQKIGYDEKTSALAIHRSAKTLLDNVNNSFREIPEYIRGFDKFMNIWKSVTLVTPGFHMRNLFGNMANMSFAGMNVAQQSRYAGKAMGDFSVYSRLSKELSGFSGTYDDFIATLAKSDADIFKRVSDFFESGVSQSYAGVRDLAGVSKLAKEGGQTLPKQLVGVNFDLAEHMDDFQRYMLYQWALDKNTAKFGKEAGLEAWQIAAKADEAAQQIVAESLFDYKHFTTFEKDVMKRVFPFYTFFKNNLVFQAQTVFKNPGAIGRLGRTYKYASEDLAGVDIESMPDYVSGNMWLPIPAEIRKGDKEAIAFLKLNLPIADFTELIENPFNRGAGSVAAPIKLFFELGAGVDSFTGAPLSAFPGEKDRMDPGSGVLSALRNEDGDFALSANPVMQKIANDLGLRVPKEYLSVLLDVADSVAGKQAPPETLFDALDRFGLTATKEVQGMQLTQLYQKLEQLRYMRERYEQETGQDLPTKAQLGIDETPDWMKPLR